jgi:sulfite exporter TauE/SafE
MSIDFLSAFIVGLLGGGHCIGMCGGITSMLTSAIPQSANNRFGLIGYYNLGRILSYSVLGFIVGLTGSLAAKSIGMPLMYLRIVAAVFLILLGLYLGQWLLWLTYIEKLGKGLWQKISPLANKFIPVQSKKQALALGALWGWLPCGLIYSTLTWALASADAINGALIMLFFGLGTLPALLTMSFGVIKLKQLLINTLFRKSMAFLLICYGFYNLSIA